MAERKSRKWLWIILAAPVVLATGLYIFVKVKFPPERIRALILEQGEAFLHRKITLGEAHLGFTGVSLSELAIAEREGFPAGTFVSAKQLSVRPRLLALLHKQIVIDSVVLDSPQVVLRRREDGVLNISDLMASSAPAKPGEPASGGGTSLAVGSIALKDGSVRWIDAVNKSDVSLAKTNINVTGLSLANPFGVKGSGEISGKLSAKPIDGKFAIDAKLDPAAKGVHLGNFEAAWNGSTIRAKGTIQNPDSPTADLSVTLDPLATDSLAVFTDLPAEAKGMRVKGELQAKGSAGNVHLSGPLTVDGPGLSASAGIDGKAQVSSGTANLDFTLTPQKLELQGSPLAGDLRISGPLAGSVKLKGNPDNLGFVVDMDAGGAAVAYGSYFEKPAGSPLKIAMQGKKTAEALRIDQSRIESAAGPLAIQGEMRSGKATALDFTASAPSLDLAAASRLVPSLADLEPKGKAAVTAKITGTTDVPQIRGTAELSSLAAKLAGGAGLTDGSGSAEFTMDSAALKNFRAKFGGSPFTLTANVKNFDHPAIDFNARMDRLDAEAFLKAFAEGTKAKPGSKDSKTPAPPEPPMVIARATGKLFVGEIVHPKYVGHKFDLSLNLANIASDLSKLDGTAAFTASSGTIRNLPFAAKINELIHHAGDEINYDNIASHFISARMARVPKAVETR